MSGRHYSPEEWAEIDAILKTKDDAEDDDDGDIDEIFESEWSTACFEPHYDDDENIGVLVQYQIGKSRRGYHSGLITDDGWDGWSDPFPTRERAELDANRRLESFCEGRVISGVTPGPWHELPELPPIRVTTPELASLVAMLQSRQSRVRIQVSHNEHGHYSQLQIFSSATYRYQDPEWNGPFPTRQMAENYASKKLVRFLLGCGCLCPKRVPCVKPNEIRKS